MRKSILREALPKPNVLQLSEYDITQKIMDSLVNPCHRAVLFSIVTESKIANQISATLRQGLLIYEVVHAMNKPQKPVVGTLIKQDEISSWRKDPRGFMTWLRDTTIALGSKR